MIPQQIIRFTGRITNFLVRNEELIKKRAVPSAVGGVLGLQTVFDVKNARPEDKKNVFINNLIISTALLTGGYFSHKKVKNYLETRQAGRLMRAIANNSVVRKIVSKIPNVVKNYPGKDLIEALSIPLGAGIAGGVAGEIADRQFPVKEDLKYEVLKNTGFFQMGYQTINNSFNIDPIGLTDSMDGAFSSTIGYSVGKEKGVKNKVKKFTFEILSGSLIPLTLIIPITGYLNKNLQNYKKVKAGLILATGMASAFVGKFAADWIDKKVTKKIVEHKIWDDISRKQQELIKRSLTCVNPYEKKQLLQEAKKLSSVKSKIDKN